MAFSHQTRKQAIQQMKAEQLDLLIIGGGITGAGVALQASAAGMKTGLIDMQDFAEGTSSRSTKLVHGGLRYLKTFDVEVVADTVQERAVVQGVAPHIPKPQPMLLPIYDEPGATFNMFSVKVAMDLYDRLANVTDPRYTNYLLQKEEVLEREPQLQKENLLGGGVYLDYKNNDARLVIENIKRAAQDGAQIASHVKAETILHNDQGKVNGVRAKDLLTGETFDIQARLVINTSGPWSDFVRDLDKREDTPEQMRPTKGVHLVVDAKKLSVPQPTYFDTGDQDGRMIFVIPRENKTYFGTTDTDYHGDYDHPTVTKEDVDYLLEIVNRRYPGVGLTIQDIEASWAGLRPLIASNGGSDYNGGNNGSLSDQSFEKVIDVVSKYQRKEASRWDVEDVLSNLESTLSENESNPSAVSRGSSLETAKDGLITLAGGKLTDYRKMAEGAVKLVRDRLADEFDQTYTLIDSKRYPVSGGEIDPANVEEELDKIAQIGIEKGLSKNDATYLADLYGSNTQKVYALMDELEAAPGLSLKETLSLHYALEEEMTLRPIDFFWRRTNHLLFMRDALDDIKQPVIDEMARYYQWSDEEKKHQMKELEAAIAQSDLADLK
ncbi:type 1 glycerol-3-phosphate oxidase [Pisciglobus halotolerans]|uniref:Alpha-glycerophosphate oxidase n=1 Tax=Pisciglobus halotolerans TaxID=745365 RepID=A0A1I3BTI4_9LACT|nr:type 1 glycerol-3-phosphate oxidase [Pisciglobus halotolerans]SFH65628.1 glycerol 3-phosphate oxidase [Pisciglobus halotolerans]